MTYHFVSFKERIIRSLKRIIFLLALSPVSLFSQQYFFNTFGVQEGLDQSTIFDMVQDQFDYLWLGTRAGVSRFNGQEFFNYTSDDGIADNAVKILFRDEDNRIWMGHYEGGISVYDGHNFRVFHQSGAIFKTDITGILKDKDGNIWICSEGSGVVKITEPGNTLEESKYEFYIGDDLSDRVFGSYLTSDGRLFFITDAFIKEYNYEKNEFVGFSPDGMPRYFIITCMFEDKDKDLWFGTYHGGLYKYNSKADTFKVFDLRDGLASNWIFNITQDHLGNMWVGHVEGGITVISRDNKMTVYNTENGLPDITIRKILEDAEGNMLIGTNENGIAIFNGENFVSYFQKDGLISSQIYSVMQDKNGKYWIGTEKGINILENRTISTFHKLNGEKINSIKQDAKGRIFFVASEEGVYTYDPDNLQFGYDPLLNRSIPNLNATALENDLSGNIFIGADDGLLKYNYDSRLVENKLTQINGLASSAISALYCDQKGKLWIGTRNSGLNYYEGGDTCYQVKGHKNSYTPNCIRVDSKGNIWVGTISNGVMVIEPDSFRIIKNLKVNDGLQANLINLIEIDESGKIYIGTNKGLNIYDSEKDRIFSYNQQNGFVGIETNPGAVFYGNEGLLWFGTKNGLTSYDPYVSRKMNVEPLTHIVNMKVNLEDISMSEELRLNYKENDVIIDYTSICLTNPDAVAYQIYLEGADDNWRPVTKQTRVFYPSLAPKKYCFKVKGRNSDGIWNTEPITYCFQIDPPFYKTTWFILLMVIIVIAGIITYVKIRERNLLIEKRILEEKVKERTIEVVAQKEELAEKNKDITDSIRYAKRIQVAMLPPSVPYEETFVLYKPKDIVSGDFYWIETVGDREFIAAVDCTGHGVPGAFMSIIGANSLNKIVKEKGVYKPSEILNLMDVEVVQSLQSTDEGQALYDGMDLALICYNRKTKELEYAGGYNPLIYIKDGEMEEIKADRFGIGRTAEEFEKKFTNHKFKVKKGDAVYIFSDGYADQFGGETGKKFKSKPMKELFLAIWDKSANEQQEILNKTIETWRGPIEQVDDILVIGRRF
jgi:ligand-binding sensor domain-containing protein/serine phosphatase RsbU (regulator of sigma subunit)